MPVLDSFAICAWDFLMSKFHIAKCKLSVETEIVDDASYVPELAGQCADNFTPTGSLSVPVTCGVPLWHGCVSLGGNTAGRPSLLQPLKPVRQELLSISDYAGCSNHTFYHLQPVLSLNTVLTVKEGRYAMLIKDLFAASLCLCF